MPETGCLAELRELPVFSQLIFMRLKKTRLSAGDRPAAALHATNAGCPDADNREQSHLSAFFIIYI